MMTSKMNAMELHEDRLNKVNGGAYTGISAANYAKILQTAKAKTAKKNILSNDLQLVIEDTSNSNVALANVI